MDDLKKLIVDSLDRAFEEVIKKDEEYVAVEKEKKLILSRLKEDLSDEDFLLVENLIKCMDKQKHIKYVF